MAAERTSATKMRGHARVFLTTAKRMRVQKCVRARRLQTPAKILGFSPAESLRFESAPSPTVTGRVYATKGTLPSDCADTAVVPPAVEERSITMF